MPEQIPLCADCGEVVNPETFEGCKCDGLSYCKTCDDKTFSIQCGNCSGNIECENCEAFPRENDWICQSCLENGPDERELDESDEKIVEAAWQKHKAAKPST